MHHLKLCLAEGNLMIKIKSPKMGRKKRKRWNNSIKICKIGP